MKLYQRWSLHGLTGRYEDDDTIFFVGRKVTLIFNAVKRRWLICPAPRDPVAAFDKPHLWMESMSVRKLFVRAGITSSLLGLLCCLSSATIPVRFISWLHGPINFGKDLSNPSFGNPAGTIPDEARDELRNIFD